MNTDIPQCLLIDSPAFVAAKTNIRFFQKNLPQFLNKAAIIITFSDASGSQLIGGFNIAPAKIKVISSGVSVAFQPATDEIQYNIKQTYTGGKEFFLYNGPLYPSQTLVTLLKAFSLFKKRQQSNMQLLFCGQPDPRNSTFIKNLQTYKYRSDVVMATDFDEATTALVTAAAYATVYPVTDDGFGIPLMKSLRCHTPVITADTAINREIAGNAALYADATSHQSIADQLMHMYKDETGRSQLIKAAINMDTTFSWDHTANLLWSALNNSSH